METLEEIKESHWYKTKPKIIRELICQFPPDSAVLIKKTQQKAQIYSYFEDGTLKVSIDPAENKTVGTVYSEPYLVFGYKPADLELIEE